jgi:hypothetical protein
MEPSRRGMDMRGLALLLVSLLASQAQADVLTGVILQEDGQPAPGAAVTAAGIFRSPPLRLKCTANEQGKFRIEVPPLTGSARYMLAVRWNLQGAQVTETVDGVGKPTGINARTPQFVTVRLRQAGELKGRLLQDEDGAPIPDARLFLDTGEVLTTDSNGAFHIRGLPLADHSLIPVAKGRVREYVLFDTTLRPDAELDLRLPRGAVIRGKVTDDAGQPIPGAYLSRASSGTALTLNGWDEECGPDGTFEYGGLSSERLFYSLEAKAPGYESQSISAEVGSVTRVVDRNVILKKKPNSQLASATKPTPAPQPPTKLASASGIRRQIVGTVTDAAGLPIAKAAVRWGAYRWDDSVKSTTTAADGAFTLENVPEGSAAVLVVAEGFAPRFVSVESRSDVKITLDPGVEVRGVIRNSVGAPVANAQIILVTRCFDTGFCNPIWLDDRSARSDDKGEFVIANVPAAGVTFDVLKQGYSEQRDMSLASGPMLNEVQLKAGGGITGWVLKGKDDPVRDFRIRVLIPRQFERPEKVGGYYAGFDWYGVRFTRNDGVFTLTDVNADHWHRLIVSSPGVGYTVLDRVRSDSLDALSPPENLTINLKPFRPLSVVVTDDKGRPIKEARVALLEDSKGLSNGFRWGSDDLWSKRQRTDEQGKAVFPEPTCEDGILTVTAPCFARQCFEWHGEPGPIAVSLSAGATLKGEVRVGEDLVQTGFLHVVGPGQMMFGANFEKEHGRFEFDGIAAGEYQVTVDVDGRKHVETVLLTAEETRVLKINLAPEKR